MSDQELIGQELYLRRLAEIGEQVAKDLEREVLGIMATKDCVAVLKSARHRMQAIIEGTAHAAPTGCPEVTALEPVQIERIMRELDDITGGDS